MDIEYGSAMSLAQPLGICRESEKVGLTDQIYDNGFE